MPIDASSDPYGGGLGPDPATTKADPDLGAAGTGAKSAALDATDFHKEPAGTEAVTPKAGIELSLDDAGRGAKVDPSLHHDDPAGPATKTGLGGALDHVDDGAHDHGTKDLGLDGGKHLDIGAPSHDDHLKGLHGAEDLHDDHDDLHGHDHHDHHDLHDLHGAADHHDTGYDHHH